MALEELALAAPLFFTEAPVAFLPDFLLEAADEVLRETPEDLGVDSTPAAL
jgi:hypothetical protein